jgi:hypothetical protein
MNEKLKKLEHEKYVTEKYRSFFLFSWLMVLESAMTIAGSEVFALMFVSRLPNRNTKKKMRNSKKQHNLSTFLSKVLT